MERRQRVLILQDTLRRGAKGDEVDRVTPRYLPRYVMLQIATNHATMRFADYRKSNYVLHATGRAGQPGHKIKWASKRLVSDFLSLSTSDGSLESYSSEETSS